MSHAAASASRDVLFCQRNNRLWVAVLVVSAVAVLALAIWLGLRGEPSASSDLMVADGYTSGPVVGVAAGQALAPPQAPFPPPQAVLAPGSVQPGTAQPVARQLMAPAMTGSPFVPVAAGAPLSTAERLQSSFNQVADQIRPTVVNINAVRATQRQLGRVGTGPRFAPPFDGVPDKIIGQQAFESIGSGVIIDESGYVVTNDHVVDGAVAIMVTRFNQGDPIAATIVATDRSRDLALLKLQGSGPFPAATLADSSKVEVGDWVLAVGNPFGLGHTVTSGIVSSRRSSIPIGGVVYKDLLQTDAPINRGSSGGPLVSLHGQVVGINTAIYAPSGTFNGTGFAIPSNQVGSFVASAMTGAFATPGAAQGGSVQAAVPAPTVAPASPRAWLGIQGTDVTPAMAQKLRLDRPEGVFVTAVEPGSPAQQAEISRGDVIISMAGQPVRNQQSLGDIVAALPPSLRVPVVTMRDGDRETTKVRLGFGGRP